MTEHVVPEFLVNYLAARKAQRAEAVNAKFNSLTDREQALVREASVMGYVQGMRHPRGEDIPRDGQIVAVVLDACLSPAFADRYPAINKVASPGADEAE